MSENLILDAECPRCGLVELTRDQAWLVLASEPSLCHYAFTCPQCATCVRHHADDAIVEVLAPLLAVEVLDVPAEALEARTGPALTTDDLLDFCLALDAAGPPSQLSAGTGVAEWRLNGPPSAPLGRHSVLERHRQTPPHR